MKTRKLINLLKVIKIDGDIYTDDYDSRYGFVWDNNIKFTSTGKRKFCKILLSNATIVNGHNIFLNNKSITQEDLDLFLGALAGYVSIDEYNKWFKNEVEESK